MNYRANYTTFVRGVAGFFSKPGNGWRAAGHGLPCAPARSLGWLVRVARCCALAVFVIGLTACSTVKTSARSPVGETSIAYAVGGNGAPALVLQAGFGNSKDAWAPVFGDMQRHHTVLAWDRPGYGDSPSVAGTRDACTIAKEQRQLLRAAGLRPPYVLVGHSLGGLYQYVYAKLYPEDVAGLVLLDPTHPDHWKHMQADTEGLALFLKSMRVLAFDSTMRREFDAQTDCLDGIHMQTPLAVPTRILVSTVFNPLEQGAFAQMVRKDREDWLRLTGAGALHEIAGAGHFMHKDQPQAVVRDIEAFAASLTP